MSLPSCSFQSCTSPPATAASVAARRVGSRRCKVISRPHQHASRALPHALPQNSHIFVPEDRHQLSEQGHSSLLPKQRALALGFSDVPTMLPKQPVAPRFPTPSAASSKRPLRVAVDVDEVLGRFLYALNIFCKEQYDMEYNIHDYWIYEFAKIWNCSTDHSNHIVHEFFKSQHFNDGIPVIPGALETLQRLQGYCELVVVTSRQHIIQEATMEWIDNHYPGIFQDVYFGNHFALDGVSRKKSEICKSVGAHVLIDDNPTYAKECAAEGLNVLLYDWEGGYPWSKIPEHQEMGGISVVRSWDEVEEQLALMHQELSLL